MIEITDAQIYSVSGAMAYQIEYSDGTKVRAVEARNEIIRREYLKSDKWVEIGKAYIADRRVNTRAAELIKTAALQFLFA